MISGPTGWPCCRARLDGYRAAMDAAGVRLDPDLVRVSTLYVEGGLRDGQALLSLPDPPTAVFTANDLQAPASTRRQGRPGSAFRRSSAWWDSTIWRSPSGRGRR
jgi:hypothetical protein